MTIGEKEFISIEYAPRKNERCISSKDAVKILSAMNESAGLLFLKNHTTEPLRNHDATANVRIAEEETMILERSSTGDTINTAFGWINIIISCPKEENDRCNNCALNVNNV
jgi:hypothetical protein